LTGKAKGAGPSGIKKKKRATLELMMDQKRLGLLGGRPKSKSFKKTDRENILGASSVAQNKIEPMKWKRGKIT